MRRYGRGCKDGGWWHTPLRQATPTPAFLDASSGLGMGIDGNRANGKVEIGKASPIWTAELIHKLEAEFSPLASLETDHIPPPQPTMGHNNTTNTAPAQHSPAPPLQWEDIEYAYVYEGALLPGGKIMMGRWWRCGTVLGGGDGGEGFEVVEDNTILGDDGEDDGVGGQGVVGGGGAEGAGGGEVDGDTEMHGAGAGAGAGADGVGDGEIGGEGTARVRGGWGRERGAWVFWS